MNEKPYHHKNLKYDLIKAGIGLLSEKGPEGFSLREAARLCGVSHTAPYNHFRDKDDMIEAIAGFAGNALALSLEEAGKTAGGDFFRKIVEIGKAYVKFMVENPSYFKCMFLNKSVSFEDMAKSSGAESSFAVFRDAAADYLESVGAPEKERPYDITAMWAMAHGLAVIIMNGNVDIEGDYIAFAGKIFSEKLKFG